ncbi:NAD(P)/FAD-dependent oxidoreductase [Alicyclobacillus sp. SO9]|nr:NAD(P)/FAD-dependent oxidoreductase [Alicyclobacillus sp. SO9]
MRKTDVLVVGGGVAGLSCALYTSRAGLSTTVLDTGMSQLKKVSELHNIPGLPKGISGEDWVATARSQAENAGAEIRQLEATAFDLKQRPYQVFTNSLETGEKLSFASDYVVIAVNLGYPLLEDMDLGLEVNEFVPSKKIRKVKNITFEGRTTKPGVYIAGLLADIPSQTAVSSGQGTYVGVQIASEALGRAYMWHDR